MQPGLFTWRVVRGSLSIQHVLLLTLTSSRYYCRSRKECSSNELDERTAADSTFYCRPSPKSGAACCLGARVDEARSVGHNEGAAPELDPAWGKVIKGQATGTWGEEQGRAQDGRSQTSRRRCIRYVAWAAVQRPLHGQCPYTFSLGYC
jgi:hypothetical protein